jgi:hypothetical protein
MNFADSQLRFLRILHGALLISILFYGAFGEKLGPAEPKDLKFLPPLFAAPAIVNALIALFFRARMVRPAEDALRLRADDAQALGRWRVGNIVVLVMCESVALFGFVLRMLGGTLLISAPFYMVAILLMLLWTPRLEISRGQS